jgi:hypothetical protein
VLSILVPVFNLGIAMKDQRATELDPNFVLAAATRCLVSIMLQAINKICFPNSDKAP